MPKMKSYKSFKYSEQNKHVPGLLKFFPEKQELLPRRIIILTLYNRYVFVYNNFVKK